MNLRDKMLQLEQRMNAQVLGQENVVRMLLIALLCDGHILLEGLPGLAKTRAASWRGISSASFAVSSSLRICCHQISPAARFISKMPAAKRSSFVFARGRYSAT